MYAFELHTFQIIWQGVVIRQAHYLTIISPNHYFWARNMLYSPGKKQYFNNTTFLSKALDIIININFIKSILSYAIYTCGDYVQNGAWILYTSFSTAHNER